MAPERSEGATKGLRVKKMWCVKNVVCYVTLRSANHTVIRVVNTTQCHIIHQLVWYAHFIFYRV